MSEEIIKTRSCTLCGEEKTLITEFFHRNSANVDGFQPQCKNCKRERARERNKNYRKKHDEGLTRIPEHKKCPSCLELKSNDHFYKNKSRKDGLSFKCKTCDNERKRRYISENREKVWAFATLKKHGIKYSIKISKEELVKIIENDACCKICGVMLDYGKKEGNKMNNKSPTLDRINNDNEIRKDNVQVLCAKCNGTKRDRTMKDFIEYCKMVVDRFE